MALRRLTDCIEEMQEKHQIPNQKREGIANCTASKQYVRWEEVQDFLLMAEEAISAKDAAAQRAIEEAQNLGSNDEVDFLLQEISKISEERTALLQSVQQLTRANESLTEEITLIRAHIEDTVPPSPGFLPPTDGQHSRQLATERARTTALENELDSLKIEMYSLKMKDATKEEVSPNSPRIPAGKNTNTNRKKKHNKKTKQNKLTPTG